MVKTFQEVRDYLARISSIHQGGCAVSALAMMLWLEKKKVTMDNFYIVAKHAEWDRGKL